MRPITVLIAAGIVMSLTMTVRAAPDAAAASSNIPLAAPDAGANARAGETLRGVVASVDERNDSITLRLPSDVSTVLKVRDGLLFNAVRYGDQVRVWPPEPTHELPQPEDIPLDILYQDEYLALINKPFDMVVHPAKGHWSGTLVNALQFHYDTLSTAGGGNCSKEMAATKPPRSRVRGMVRVLHVAFSAVWTFSDGGKTCHLAGFGR